LLDARLAHFDADQTTQVSLLSNDSLIAVKEVGPTPDYFTLDPGA
jgi:hypothetical protein